MMVSRFLCVWTSGLLLLLATDGATDDSATICLTESTACQNDVACLSCLSTVTEDDEEFTECGEALGLDEATSSAWSCSDVLCCLDEVSEEACLENAAYEEFLLCFLEETFGCMDDDLTCSGASPRVGGAWTGVAFVGSTIALLPLLLWV